MINQSSARYDRSILDGVSWIKQSYKDRRALLMLAFFESFLSKENIRDANEHASFAAPFFVVLQLSSEHLESRARIPFFVSF
jgi:hypothetical protein